VREAADFSQRFDASCACSGRSTACYCGGRRKDHIDRRLGGRNVDSHGNCEHVPHTSNAIGVTSMLAAGYILAISLSARSTGKHDPNCANGADMPRGKFIGKRVDQHERGRALLEMQHVRRLVMHAKSLSEERSGSSPLTLSFGWRETAAASRINPQRWHSA
jgi:hypothetical protein